MTALIQGVVVEEAPVSEFEPFASNVNVMGAEEYQALADDMKAHGEGSIDPIAAVYKSTLDRGCSDSRRKVVLNGNHRLKAAKQMGWTTIRYFIDHTVTSEEEARSYSYRKNSERGRVDDFKLAETFKWLHEKRGLTEMQIGQLFGINHTTVSKKMRLAKLPPEIKALVEGSAVISVWHLEPLSGLPPEVQKKLVELIVPGRLTVDDVKGLVKTVRDEIQADLRAKERLEKVVMGSDFKVCPTCGEAPRAFEEGRSVICMKLASLPVIEAPKHIWSLDTGLTNAQVHKNATDQASNSLESTKLELEPVRTKHTIEEFDAAVLRSVREILPKIDGVTSVDLVGAMDGRPVVLRMERFESGLQFDLKTGTRGQPTKALHLNVKREISPDGFMTVLTDSAVKSEDVARKLVRAAELFLSKRWTRALSREGEEE